MLFYKEKTILFLFSPQHSFSSFFISFFISFRFSLFLFLNTVQRLFLWDLFFIDFQVTILFFCVSFFSLPLTFSFLFLLHFSVWIYLFVFIHFSLFLSLLFSLFLTFLSNFLPFPCLYIHFSVLYFYNTLTIHHSSTRKFTYIFVQIQTNAVPFCLITISSIRCFSLYLAHSSPQHTSTLSFYTGPSHIR